MKGNTFGKLFRIATWGESHGNSVGVVIDGCPAGLELSEADFPAEMSRRQGAKQDFSTPRKEKDQVIIESGVFAGKTTGTPIALRILNQNTKSKDYSAFIHTPRPGHADFSTMKKHSHRDYRGGGRLSARETATRVAAAVVAKKILKQKNIEILAFIQRIGNLSVESEKIPFHQVNQTEIRQSWWPRILRLREENPLCLPLSYYQDFTELVEQAKEKQDSLGGAIECWVRGLEAGIGEPIFEKLNALLAQAFMSLPATTGFESGGGIRMSQLYGSQIRDPIELDPDNNAYVNGNSHGGLLGGMSSGEPLWTRLHFHAPTSIPQEIASVNMQTKQKESIQVKGRHDCFPLVRAVPIVEAMMALVLVDAIAQHQALADF